MSSINTNRRQLYLPKELDDWFIKENERTGIRVNALMIEALKEYAVKRSDKSRKKKSDFEKDVGNIVLALLKEKGLV